MFATFLPILFTIFVVIDPFGLVPIYIGLSSHLEVHEKDRTIRRAVLTAFFILFIFILAGKWLLQLLHIHPGSFCIAGGILLFIVSIEMLFGQATKSKVSYQEQQGHSDEEERISVAVFPLAIPLLAGPGAITTILLYTSTEGEIIPIMIMLVISVAFTLGIAALAMKGSHVVIHALGKTGVSVIERIMGLLLSGLSVQFVYDGLVKLHIIPAGIL
ncbi:MAG: MarC family protein [Treponemataceae bacterium]|nr:MarC family protein [Treponemataceae bacterium]